MVAEIHQWNVQFCAPNVEWTAMANFAVSVAGHGSGPGAGLAVTAVKEVMKRLYGGFPIGGKLRVYSDRLEYQAAPFSGLAFKNPPALSIPRAEISGVRWTGGVLKAALLGPFGKPHVIVSVRNVGELKFMSDLRSKQICEALTAWL